MTNKIFIIFFTEKNKATPNAGKSALTSLLSGETSTPTAQKTVIGTRRIIMTKGADGTTRVIAQPLPKPETPKPATPALKDGPQKVQIIRGPDGKLAVRGLLPGQQLIQMPDGKLHVVSAGQQNAVGQLIASANTPDKTKEVSNITPTLQNMHKLYLNFMLFYIEFLKFVMF